MGVTPIEEATFGGVMLKRICSPPDPTVPFNRLSYAGMPL